MLKIYYLSDQSLATHIRNSFNNKLGISNVDEVYELHQENFQLIRLTS